MLKLKGKEAFKFESNPYASFRGKSDGEWVCKNCDIEAQTEHNNPECHACADWSGCGEDCKLSRVYCSKCGESFDV